MQHESIEVIFRKVRDTRRYARFEVEGASKEVGIGVLYFDKSWIAGAEQVTATISKNGATSAEPLTDEKVAGH